MNLSGQVAFVGAATTQFAKAITDKTSYGLQLEAAMKAVADAGLKKDDIDGIITGEGGGDGGNPRTHIAFSEMFGVFNKAVCIGLPVGGGTCGLSVVVARWAIASGRCKNVLIVNGSATSAQIGRSAVGNRRTDNLALFKGHSPTYEQPFGPLVITFYAAVARRHMYEYGTTHEQLAAIAVAQRKHASLNPEAMMRKPITVEDVINSRPITTPFHLLDCCLNSDGGAALVMTSAERAKDAPKPPVYVLGLGHASTSYFTGDLARPRPELGLSLTSTIGRLAGDDAFGEAGVSRDDVQFVELYDNFTISPLIQLEDLGFCAKGDGGPFVEGGRIEPGGALPLNTHGGHLSCNFTPAGYNHWVEGVRQLRGECGDRQVPNARIGLVSTFASTIATFGGVGILARD
jgi:acetyl-CoA acetyltransferase